MHHVKFLQELSQKEDMIAKMEQGLETYKGKFAVCRHQLGLIYRQYNEEKNQWGKDKTTLEKKLQDLEGSISEDKIRIQEYNVSLSFISEYCSWNREGSDTCMRSVLS